MRFESLLWTVMALFLVGGAVMQGDPLGDGMSGGQQYEAKDGEQKIPPAIMEPGATTTAPAQLTK
jgi:hypothetical protein